MQTTDLTQLLSAESRLFLENLRLYLFSKGKHSNEVEDVIAELTDHLYEAEKAGKPIEKIIGNSPKEYMQSISNELGVGIKDSFSNIVLFIFGLISYNFLNDFFKGHMSYSIFELIGQTVNVFIVLAILIFSIRYISSHTLSKKKEFTIFALVSATISLLFISVFTLNFFVSSYTIELNQFTMNMIALISVCVVIFLSFWSKTWILPITLILLIMPGYVLNFSQLEEVTQLITSTIITYLGLAIYLFVTVKLNKT